MEANAFREHRRRPAGDHGVHQHKRPVGELRRIAVRRDGGQHHQRRVAPDEEKWHCVERHATAQPERGGIEQREHAEKRRKDEEHAQRDGDARAVTLQQRVVPAGVSDPRLLMHGEEKRPQGVRLIDDQVERCEQNQPRAGVDQPATAELCRRDRGDREHAGSRQHEDLRAK